MNQTALQKQLDELNRELRYAGDAVDKRLIGLRAEIDRLKIDMAALAKFLESKYPEFPNEFDRIRNETRLEVDPEFE